MALDKKVTGKKSGDPIVSSDWNALADETIRLDTAKLDLAQGGTVAGLLTAAAGLATPSVRSDTLGVSVHRPANNQWVHSTNQQSGLAVITATIDFPAKTTVLVLGHGHANSSSDAVTARAVLVQLRMDGTLLSATGGQTWGGAYLSLPANAWAPVIAVGTAQVEKGSHRFELLLKPGQEGTYTVNLNGPSLWIARVGSF